MSVRGEWVEGLADRATAAGEWCVEQWHSFEQFMLHDFASEDRWHLVRRWLGWLLVALALVPTGWGQALVSEVGSWPLTHVVTDPVRRYLTDHAVGLPLSASALATLWVLSGVVLFACSFYRATGARLGWLLFGGLTTAMVWAGTARPGQWVAAGAAVLCWALLSVVALRSWRPGN